MNEINRREVGCDEAQVALDMLDHGVAVPTETEVRAHVASCAVCQAYAGLGEQLTGEPAPAVVDVDVAALSAKLRKERAQLWLTLLAAPVLLVGLWLYWRATGDWFATAGMLLFVIVPMGYVVGQGLALRRLPPSFSGEFLVFAERDLDRKQALLRLAIAGIASLFGLVTIGLWWVGALTIDWRLVIGWLVIGYLLFELVRARREMLRTLVTLRARHV